MSYQDETRPLGRAGSKDRVLAGSISSLPATCPGVAEDALQVGIPRVPALNEMTDRAQVVALAYYQMGRTDGWVAGYDHAQREHWRLPEYGDAVRTIIDTATTAIDRERNGYIRRRGVA